MKVLWITNLLFPDICKKLKRPVPAIGGWMYSSAKLLTDKYNIKLAVAAVGSDCGLQVFDTDSFRYYLLPLKTNPVDYKKGLEKYWQQIKTDFQPDVVHIHGTEFTHGLAYLKSCEVNNVVVSIQGLVSVYERYYYADMSVGDILKNISFRDLIRNNNIFQQKNSFKKRGCWEKEYILSAPYVIGRTSWDKIHVKTVNPDVRYCFCDETLRPSFYSGYWKKEDCVPHSIFCSQASYPIKGLHQVLKALPLILRLYPDTKLYISGTNILQRNSLISKIKFSGYARYIRKLINKSGLDKHIVFLGMLDEKAMYGQYLKSHVFVCPSSIENSPNSLGEAQLLGVPCVASYVGGIPDMVEPGKDGLLYRFEEYEMMAHHICAVFADNELAELLSANARKVAALRHDPAKCRDRLFQIYQEVSGQDVDHI